MGIRNPITPMILASIFLIAPAFADDAKPDVPRVVGEAVDWLVDNQQPNGSWGTFHTARPMEIMAAVPGSHHAFRVATTALCVIALASLRIAPAESVSRPMLGGGARDPG